VSVDLAATLLVEARLTHDWLNELGLGARALAAPPGRAVALSAAEADYLRGLSVGRSRRHGAASSAPGATTVSLPVRLVARCSPALLDRAARSDLEVAIAWEIGALREGLGIGEWIAWRAAQAASSPKGDAA
jgi:hypothetical protein